MIFRIFILLSLSMLSACKDPLDAYYKQLKLYGYIPYTTPLAVAGTGTLIGGSPKSMAVIANPETCFPEIPGEPRLRYRDDSTLPKTTVHFSVSTNVQVRFLKALSAGAPSIQAGLKLNDISNMEVDFQGVHIEYIDSVHLVDYYRQHVSNICKDYLDKVGFIIQAIVVDQMKVSLYTHDGGQFQLTVNNTNQYFDLSVDTEWEVDTTGSLIITTPKYIGYQLGQLREQDQGLSLRRATKTILNHWIFEDIGIFKNIE